MSLVGFPYPETTPEVATALLRHFSYGPSAKVPGRYEVWTTRDTDREILVPLNPESGDFAVLLSRAVRAIFAERGDAAHRVFDLLTLKVDSALASTQWKKETAVNAGLIPWADGEALYRAAQAALSASAKATRLKRMLHGSSSAYIAKRFLENTLMGQTEIGSFVITAHVPSNQRFYVSRKSENRAQVDYRNAERVTGREILETLERSLEAVRAGLDDYKRTPRVEVFLPLVEDGVSHELVKALSVMTLNGDAAISIEQIADTATLRRVEIPFDSVESEVLGKVADRFAQAEPPRTVLVTGEVSGLDNSSSSPIHLVKLDIVRGADIRHARVRLTPDQYAMAVQAHAESLWLTVAGQLEKDGREYWLYGATDVGFVTPPPGAISAPIELGIEESAP